VGDGGEEEDNASMEVDKEMSVSQIRLLIICYWHRHILSMMYAVMMICTVSKDIKTLRQKLAEGLVKRWGAESKVHHLRKIHRLWTALDPPSSPPNGLHKLCCRHNPPPRLMPAPFDLMTSCSLSSRAAFSATTLA
jgi:hypothetical protein